MVGLPLGRARAEPRAAATPRIRHHADAGLDNQLAFLDAALDWVADNTPRDRETRYLEARVTSWHNADPPGAGCCGATSARTRGDRRRGRAPRRDRAFDELLGRAGQHAGPRAAAGAGRPGRAPAPAAVPRRRPGRADLPGRLLRALRRLVSGAARARSTSGCSGSRRWPPSPCRSACSPALATATTFAIVAYNLFLSTTHFHNNRAYLVIVLGAAGGGAVRTGAVGGRVAPPPPGAAGARPARRRPGRCGCCGSSAPRSTARPG